MAIQTGLTSLDDLVASPFARLTALLDGIAPGAPPIDLSLGEPRALIPSFLGPTLERHLSEFGRYPPIRASRRCDRPSPPGWGAAIRLSPACRPRDAGAAAQRLARRAVLRRSFRRWRERPPSRVRRCSFPTRSIKPMPLPRRPPAPSPCFSTATRATQFLPDLDAIDESSCSGPSRSISARRRTRKARSPIAAISPRPSRSRAASISCCSPTSAIRRSMPTPRPPARSRRRLRRDGSFANVVIFNSLSKRSGLPGLRSGFVAGDADFIAPFARFRNVACPQVPLPIQHVSVAAWSDEAHVEQGRALYRQNFDIADAVLQGRYGYRRPQGGFFLWLDMAAHGGGEAAAKTLWKGCGVRLLPGKYLARAGASGAILAKTTSGLRSCTTPRPRARLWRASSPHWGRDGQQTQTEGAAAAPAGRGRVRA